MQLGLPHSVRTQVVFQSRVVRRINDYKKFSRELEKIA
jgi:hypothetical protein